MTTKDSVRTFVKTKEFRFYLVEGSFPEKLLQRAIHAMMTSGSRNGDSWTSNFCVLEGGPGEEDKYHYFTASCTLRESWEEVK